MNNGYRLVALKRRIAKIERAKDVQQADGPFNLMLIEQLNEPPCAGEQEAFLRLLSSISDRTNQNERARAKRS